MNRRVAAIVATAAAAGVVAVAGAGAARAFNPCDALLAARNYHSANGDVDYAQTLTGMMSSYDCPSGAYGNGLGTNAGIQGRNY
jgi:hypothetical protein